MRLLISVRALLFALISLSMLPGQAAAQPFSITNYQFINEVRTTRTQSLVSYKADLVNPGAAFAAVTATLTSMDPSSFAVMQNQGTLNFAPVPANSHTTSSNTFTILVDRTVPFDSTFSKLQWGFQTTSLQAPVANAGPNQNAQVGSTVTLNGSGSTNPSGIGTLTFSWAFTSKPVGSGATLTNPTSVMPTFVVDVSGNYVIMLTVSNGSASSTASVTVSTNGVPPVANAGTNQTVHVGATVHLDGTKSTDANGNPLTFTWTLTRPAGSSAILTGANTAQPTFVADKLGMYTATLVVNNGFSNSAPSTVQITTSNTAPIANAGPNQNVNVGQLVQLNGSASTDQDGDPLTYKWSFNSLPQGSNAVLSSTTAVNPTFTADVAGTYVVQLIVNDGQVNSAAATVTISTNTLAPTANAGPGQTVAHNTTVQLAGSGTDPQNLPLTFKWSLTNVPTGSTAVLNSTSIQNPTFFADKPGLYTAQLIVNNGTLSSTPSTVNITTTNTPPVANAGSPQNVKVGATVTLDGSGTKDADNDPITYAWSLTTRPQGSNATLTAANTVSPMFVADVAGNYVAQLIASDPFNGQSAPSTVMITATVTTAITLSPNPLNISTAGPGTLTVTLSAPAGAGGQTVNLGSSNTGVATVPASVTVPANNTGVNVQVTPVAVGTTTITGSASGLNSGTATVNVIAALSITTSSLANGTVNSAYSATVAATGGTTPYTWSATGLPAGLSINASSGVISGTPTAAGTSTAAITVKDSTSPQFSASANLQLIVNAPTLSITTTSPLTAGTVNAAYTATVAATGGTTPYTWSATGLPAGLSINANTGVISGTPSAAGTSNPAITVKDASSPQMSATANLSITIAPATLSITSTSPLTAGTVNAAYSATVAATGGTTPYTWSATGLPAGLSINANSGVISGTPTASGTSNPAITVKDASSPQMSATSNLSITIAPATLSITTTSPLAAGTVNAAYSATVAATGGTTPYTWSATGLPAGLSINANSGVISGTPTAVGTSNPAITVKDASSPQQSATANLSITIGTATLNITTTSPLAAGSVNAAYSATVAATGGTTPYTWSATGLPAGLSINANSGVISGTPTASGTSSAAVTVKDASSPQQSANANLTIVIAPAPVVITTASLPGGMVGALYSATVTATGGTQPYTFSATNLPAGLSISAAGAISGTPTTAGTPTAAITVKDSGSPQLSNTANLSIAISPFVSGGPQITVGSPSVGLNLQTQLMVSIPTAPLAGSGGQQITLTSGDPSKVTLNGPSGPTNTLQVLISEGTNSASVFVNGLAIGSSTFTGTATGFANGTGMVTVTPSGFILQGPNVGSSSFTVNQGQPASLNVLSERLDSNLNPVENQTIRAGLNGISVTLGNVSPSVGSLSPASVTFNAGDGVKPVTFTATNTGSASPASTTLSVNTPATFSTPNTGTMVTANVPAAGCTIAGVTVGKNLATTAFVAFNSQAQGTQSITVSSPDPSKVLLSTNGSSAGQSSITVSVANGNVRTPNFFVYGVGSSGTGTFNANAGTLGNCSGTATLFGSGFTITSALGSQFPTAIGLQTGLTVTAVALDANLSPQALAGGQNATVNLNVSNSNVGNVNPTSVSFTGGQTQGTTTFTANSAGTTTVSVVQPNGFTAPAQGTSVTATVGANSIILCQPTELGFDLQLPCTVNLSAVAPANGLTVTLSSSSSNLRISANPAQLGTQSAQVVIPAGGNFATFYISALASSGTATISGTGTGYAPGSTTITFRGTGLLLLDQFGFPAANVSLAGGTVPLGLFIYQLDAGGQLSSPGALAPGITVPMTITSSNTTVGTVTSPNLGVTPMFTPLKTGSTTINMTIPAGFTSVGFNSLPITVTP